MDPEKDPVLDPAAPAADPNAAPETPAPDPNAQLLETLNNLDARFGEIETQLSELSQKVPAPAPAPDKPSEEWVPGSWNEVVEASVNKTKEELAAEQARLEDEKRKATEQEQEAIAQLHRSFDEQITQLEKEQVIPSVKDKADPNDPGRKARQEIYAYAAQMDTTNLVEAARSLKVIHETGMTFDPKTQKFIKSNVTPSGIDAPIGSSSSTTGVPGSGPSYEQIHKARSMDELIKLSGIA